MRKFNLSAQWISALVACMFLTGCVERKLTINTEPQGALVILNDEEVGTSPVTVSFNWYGDYNVEIRKAGFETLRTHRKLDGPWYDRFPFDFFAQVLYPKRIVDSYEWTFKLKEKQQIGREELIRKAEELSKHGITVTIPHNFYALVAERHEKSSIKPVEKEKLPPDVVKWAREFNATKNLFHEDPYLKEFRSRVLGCYKNYLILESSAFYPEGGGQYLSLIHI